MNDNYYRMRYTGQEVDSLLTVADQSGRTIVQMEERISTLRDGLAVNSVIIVIFLIYLLRQSSKKLVERS